VFLGVKSAGGRPPTPGGGVELLLQFGKATAKSGAGEILAARWR
jgi:hypothetical protein